MTDIEPKGPEKRMICHVRPCPKDARQPANCQSSARRRVSAASDLWLLPDKPAGYSPPAYYMRPPPSPKKDRRDPITKDRRASPPSVGKTLCAHLDRPMSVRPGSTRPPSVPRPRRVEYRPRVARAAGSGRTRLTAASAPLESHAGLCCRQTGLSCAGRRFRGSREVVTRERGLG
jgi:hypothetical protein